MKAAQRRQIADRAAELAVDEFEKFWSAGDIDNLHPEDWLDLQHKLEDLFYDEVIK